MHISGINIVKLPDNLTCIEVEETIIGGSETQMMYSYFYNGQTLDKKGYKLDYWGKIVGVSIDGRNSLMEQICRLSRYLP